MKTLWYSSAFHTMTHILDDEVNLLSQERHLLIRLTAMILKYFLTILKSQDKKCALNKYCAVKAQLQLAAIPVRTDSIHVVVRG